MLPRLLLGYLLRRIGTGGSRRRGWRAPPPRYGYGRRRRGNFGFFGPFPTYSTRTRRGSRVTVSGCCLPIPLALAVATALAARGLLRR
jgi:hypothetical protein